MLFALALDKWVFGVSPGWWSLGGSGLILASAIFVGMQKEERPAVEARDEERGRGTAEEEMGMLSERAEDGGVEREFEGEEERGRT